MTRDVRGVGAVPSRRAVTHARSVPYSGGVLVWSDVSEVPSDFGPTVVTLGNFDGVHRGHRAVVAAVVLEARTRGVPSVAVTFEPHPLAVLRPDQAPTRLTSLEQRDVLLEQAGVDARLAMNFTLELAAWSPEKFVREVFVDRLRAVAVVVGNDARFGSRNSGNVDTLRELGQRWGFDTVVVPEVGDDAEGRWSSTWLRALLAQGDVERAAEVLGRPHRVSGVVTRGDQRGRDLGFPTANLVDCHQGMEPADGVYAGLVSCEGVGENMPAAIHVGSNATFGGVTRRVESYVIDRTDLELYDRHIDVDFLTRVRGTQAFSSVDELLQAMRRDVQECRRATAFFL